MNTLPDPSQHSPKTSHFLGVLKNIGPTCNINIYFDEYDGEKHIFITCLMMKAETTFCQPNITRYSIFDKLIHIYIMLHIKYEMLTSI